jgi:hypothetical protein
MQAHLAAHLLEWLWGQQFRKSIRNIELGIHIFDINSLVLDQFTNVVVFDIDVLDACIKRRVTSQNYRTVVVASHGCWVALGMTKSKK